MSSDDHYVTLKTCADYKIQPNTYARGSHRHRSPALLAPLIVDSMSLVIYYICMYPSRSPPVALLSSLGTRQVVPQRLTEESHVTDQGRGSDLRR